MPRSFFVRCLIVAVGAATPALADGSFPKVDNDTVLIECSDCHLAYQPQMLPQRSWLKLMDGLADHFGVPPREWLAAVGVEWTDAIAAIVEKTRAPARANPSIRAGNSTPIASSTRRPA